MSKFLTISYFHLNSVSVLCRTNHVQLNEKFKDVPSGTVIYCTVVLNVQYTTAMIRVGEILISTSFDPTDDPSTSNIRKRGTYLNPNETPLPSPSFT